MKPKMMSKNGAKAAELRRVATVLENQAKKLATPLQPDDTATIEQPRIHRKLVPVDGRNPEMPAELWDSLVALANNHDRERILGWMIRHMTDIPTAKPRALAKERLERFTDPTTPHNTTALARMRYLVKWFPNENPPKGVAPVAAEPMHIPVNDPGSGVFEAQSIIQAPEAREPSTIVLNGRSVRMVVDGDVARFISKDLVEAVGAEWKGASGSLGHIPQEYRGVCLVQTPSGAQEMVCLSEAGMNMYLFRSDKPAALPWQRHLAEVVLPQIRKTGTYTAPGAAPQLAPAANDERIVGMMTSAMSQVMAPMVQMFSSVLTHLIPGKTDAPAGAVADVIDTDAATPLGDYPKPTVDVPERTVRSMLSDLVVIGSGWRPSLPKPQADDVLRQGWSRLYREFKARYKVDIKRCARNHSERTGKHIDYLDWVETQPNGVDLMDKLYALAYLLYPPKK